MFISTTNAMGGAELTAFSTILGIIVLLGTLLWKTSAMVFRLEKDILNVKNQVKMLRNKFESLSLWSNSRVTDIENFLDIQYGFRIRKSTRDISNSGAKFLDEEQDEEQE